MGRHLWCHSSPPQAEGWTSHFLWWCNQVDKFTQWNFFFSTPPLTDALFMRVSCWPAQTEAAWVRWIMPRLLIWICWASSASFIPWNMAAGRDLWGSAKSFADVICQGFEPNWGKNWSHGKIYGQNLHLPQILVWFILRTCLSKGVENR